MTVLITRSAVPLLVALLLAACAGAPQGPSAPSEPSAAIETESQSANATPSQAIASEDSVASACLDADILAALEAYKDAEVPTDPSMDEVADALEALDLDGKAAEYRDGVVEALRDDTETLDTMRLHNAMFSLLPLESEIDLVEC